MENTRLLNALGINGAGKTSWLFKFLNIELSNWTILYSLLYYNIPLIFRSKYLLFPYRFVDSTLLNHFQDVSWQVYSKWPVQISFLAFLTSRSEYSSLTIYLSHHETLYSFDTNIKTQTAFSHPRVPGQNTLSLLSLTLQRPPSSTLDLSRTNSGQVRLRKDETRDHDPMGKSRKM